MTYLFKDHIVDRALEIHRQTLDRGSGDGDYVSDYRIVRVWDLRHELMGFFEERQSLERAVMFQEFGEGSERTKIMEEFWFDLDGKRVNLRKQGEPLAPTGEYARNKVLGMEHFGRL